MLIRREPSMNSQTAKLQLEIGKVFKVANPPEELVREGRKWVKIAPINGVEGYVNNGRVNDPVKNLQPVSCAGVK
ncbi:MAG: SH3 domain-containing protein [Stenomitos frigidus ULC029]